jgi:hypothetical protein
MDSKMECMRVQIDRDPQAEGYFSAYSPSLGRSALRKTRYLATNPKCADAGEKTSDKPAGPEDDLDAAITDPAAGIPFNSSLPGNIHSTQGFSPHTAPVNNTASNSTPIPPGRLPAQERPDFRPAPANNSIFGAKLQEALQNERK